ncbi:hypothetical protein ACIBI4_31030 [Streptomyces sp. NPDC050418]
MTSTFHQEHPDAALAGTAMLSRLVIITQPWIGGAFQTREQLLWLPVN